MTGEFCKFGRNLIGAPVFPDVGSATICRSKPSSFLALLKKMSPQNFIRQMQDYTAQVSVGASTVRGQRTPGLVTRCRQLLKEIDLRDFAVATSTAFEKRLDSATVDFRRALPGSSRHWGIARKVLNIFLRNALYNTYLREHYSLQSIESLLEIPLDSISAKGLKKQSTPKKLPRWKGVKHLTPADHATFQAQASAIAAERSLARVHLDVFLWVDRD